MFAIRPGWRRSRVWESCCRGTDIEESSLRQRSHTSIPSAEGLRHRPESVVRPHRHRSYAARGNRRVLLLDTSEKKHVRLLAGHRRAVETLNGTRPRRGVRHHSDADQSDTGSTAESGSLGRGCVPHPFAIRIRRSTLRTRSSWRRGHDRWKDKSPDHPRVRWIVFVHDFHPIE